MRLPAGAAGGVTFPSAGNTGATLGSLTTIPSSGTGWTWNGTTASITGSGATLSGYNIPGTVTISANNVTVTGCNITGAVNFGTNSTSNIQDSVLSNCVVANGGNPAVNCVGLRNAVNCTVADCTLLGASAGPGRALTNIVDVYGNSTGCAVLRCDMSWASTYAEMYQGTIAGNYMHDIGYIAGDHLDGIHHDGGGHPNGQQLNILGNTILVGADQTGAIVLNQSFDVIENVLVDGNLLAGGGYPLYAGSGGFGTTSNVVITNNWFSTVYYPQGGYQGHPAAAWDGGTGDVWTGNRWYDGPNAGQTIPHP